MVVQQPQSSLFCFFCNDCCLSDQRSGVFKVFIVVGAAKQSHKSGFKMAQIRSCDQSSFLLFSQFPSCKFGSAQPNYN